MQKDGQYVGFQSVDFGVNSDTSVGEDKLYVVNVSLDKAILFFIAVSHKVSAVILKLEFLFYSVPFAKNVT